MVTLEKIENPAWKVRLGLKNNDYGDKYETACTMEDLDGETLYISAMAGPDITKRMIRELAIKCARLGYKFLKWEREEDGVMIEHIYVLQK